MRLDTLTQLEVAEAIARKAHANMLRKFSNKEYITHPEAVAKSLTTKGQKIVGWLHDVLEDNERYSPEILHEMGIDNCYIMTVEQLTHRKGESYCDYIKRVAQFDEAIIVKLADLRHNLSDLSASNMLRPKYELAVAYLELQQKYYNATTA